MRSHYYKVDLETLQVKRVRVSFEDLQNESTLRRQFEGSAHINIITFPRDKRWYIRLYHPTVDTDKLSQRLCILVSSDKGIEIKKGNTDENIDSYDEVDRMWPKGIEGLTNVLSALVSHLDREGMFLLKEEYLKNQMLVCP